MELEFSIAAQSGLHKVDKEPFYSLTGDVQAVQSSCIPVFLAATVQCQFCER